MNKLGFVVLAAVGCADSPSGHLEATFSQVTDANVDTTPFSGDVTHVASWSDQTKVAIDSGDQRFMIVLPEPRHAGETYELDGPTLARVDGLQNLDACDAGTEDCLWWSTQSGTLTILSQDGDTVELMFEGRVEAVLAPAVGAFSIAGHGSLAL